MTPRRRAFDVAIVIAALALLVALGGLRASRKASQPSVPSTYDTGANGYAALYDMLAAEHTPVDRFELPLAQLRARTGTLVIAGEGSLDEAAPSPGSARALDRWVRQGGKLVVLDPAIGRTARRVLSLPDARSLKRSTSAIAGCALVSGIRGVAVSGVFENAYPPACTARRATIFRVGRAAAGIAYRHGLGTIVLISTPTVFDNLHVWQPGNARVAYALLGAGAVLFDEHVYGYDAGARFWDVLPQPVRIAIVLALFAAGLGIVGANLPFAPPYEAQPPDERDSGAYIASVARMLERGGAAREAVSRIASRCESVLSPRAETDQRARMLLRELRTLESTPSPGPHDVLAAGRIFARVRKDYGC